MSGTIIIAAGGTVKLGSGKGPGDIAITSVAPPPVGSGSIASPSGSIASPSGAHSSVSGASVKDPELMMTEKALESMKFGGTSDKPLQSLRKGDSMKALGSLKRGDSMKGGDSLKGDSMKDGSIYGTSSTVLMAGAAGDSITATADMPRVQAACASCGTENTVNLPTVDAGSGSGVIWKCVSCGKKNRIVEVAIDKIDEKPVDLLGCMGYHKIPCWAKALCPCILVVAGVAVVLEVCLDARMV